VLPSLFHFSFSASDGNLMPLLQQPPSDRCCSCLEGVRLGLSDLLRFVPLLLPLCLTQILVLDQDTGD
jgi:hypothetical protein